MMDGCLLLVDVDSPMMEYSERLGDSSGEVDAGDKMSHGKEGILCLDCKSTCQCKADEKYGCTVIAEAMMLVRGHRSR